jgi:hypothetical protein
VIMAGREWVLTWSCQGSCVLGSPCLARRQEEGEEVGLLLPTS